MTKAENDVVSEAGPPGSDDLKISPRAGCMLVFLIGVILFGLIWASFTLAIRGEINLQNQDLHGMRIWMIDSDLDRGLAISRSKKVSREDDSYDMCIKTTVRYFLWRSSSPEPSQSYCECYHGSTGQWQYAGACNPK